MAARTLAWAQRQLSGAGGAQTFSLNGSTNTALNPTSAGTATDQPFEVTAGVSVSIRWGGFFGAGSVGTTFFGTANSFTWTCTVYYETQSTNLWETAATDTFTESPTPSNRDRTFTFTPTHTGTVRIFVRVQGIITATSTVTGDYNTDAGNFGIGETIFAGVSSVSFTPGLVRCGGALSSLAITGLTTNPTQGFFPDTATATFTTGSAPRFADGTYTAHWQSPLGTDFNTTSIAAGTSTTLATSLIINPNNSWPASNATVDVEISADNSALSTALGGTGLPWTHFTSTYITVTDSSGNGHTGTLVGRYTDITNPASEWAGFGNALSFTGTNNGPFGTAGVDFGDLALTTPWTVDVRADWANDATFRVVAGQFTNVGSVGGWIILVNASAQPQFAWIDASGATQIIAGGTLSAGSHVFRATHSGTTATFFIDGVQVGQQTGTSWHAISTGNHVLLGKDGESDPTGGRPHPWKGQIDEFRISNIVRSDSTAAPFANDANTTLLAHLDSLTGTQSFLADPRLQVHCHAQKTSSWPHSPPDPGAPAPFNAFGDDFYLYIISADLFDGWFAAFNMNNVGQNAITGTCHLADPTVATPTSGGGGDHTFSLVTTTISGNPLGWSRQSTPATFTPGPPAGVWHWWCESTTDGTSTWSRLNNYLVFDQGHQDATGAFSGFATGLSFVSAYRDNIALETFAALSTGATSVTREARPGDSVIVGCQGLFDATGAGVYAPIAVDTGTIPGVRIFRFNQATQLMEYIVGTSTTTVNMTNDPNDTTIWTFTWAIPANQAQDHYYALMSVQLKGGDKYSQNVFIPVSHQLKTLSGLIGLPAPAT